MIPKENEGKGRVHNTIVFIMIRLYPICHGLLEPNRFLGGRAFSNFFLIKNSPHCLGEGGVKKIMNIYPLFVTFFWLPYTGTMKSLCPRPTRSVKITKKKCMLFCGTPCNM